MEEQVSGRCRWFESNPAYQVYSFEDEPEDYHRPGTNVAFIPSPLIKYLWEYEDDVLGTWNIGLRVDDTSTHDEIDAEIEHWYGEIFLWRRDGAEKQAILDAIKWMEMLKTL